MIARPERSLALAAVVLVAAGSGRAWAQAPAADTAVKPVPRVTGTDPAALAKRVQALEERIDNMWSIRQGPDVLAIETVDRLATRLLAAEARLASLEKDGSGGSQGLAVATTLSLLAATDLEPLAGGRHGVAHADLQRLRYLVTVCKLTPWPAELSPKAAALADTLHLTLKAVSRADRSQADRLASAADVARRQLLSAALGWTARAAAPDASQAHMDHTPRHGGQLGMRGDLHVEVVATGSGAEWTYSVYLSDATRTPLWVDSVKGDVLLWPDAPERVIVPLRADGDRLVGQAGAGPGAAPMDLRVRLEGTPRGHVEMDFQIPGKN